MLNETEYLGKKVTFCRLKANPQTGKVERHEGTGIVVKVYLAADQRIQFGVMVGKEIFSIDRPAINPTEEGKAAYYDHVNAIYKISDETNGITKQLSEEANAHIKNLNDAYLGAPIEFEAIEEEPAPKEAEDDGAQKAE